MKLIEPSYKIETNLDLYENKSKEELINIAYKEVELAGRTCYKSEDKITETSAKDFVNKMIKSGHNAMLEHGTIYLRMVHNYYDYNYSFRGKGIKYKNNKFSKVKFENNQEMHSDAYVTTNLRVLIENNWLEDLDYICGPTNCHEKRIQVKFICDRGISHEYVRHRVFSFAQESTRYCNYSKDKFDSELTFIIPNWMDTIGEGNYTWEDKNPIITAGGDIRTYGWDDISNLFYKEPHGKNWLECKHHHNKWQEQELYFKTLQEIENNYLVLIDYYKWTPQQARSILPNSLKTELVMTGFVSDWKHFFNLRALGTTGQPHPQAKELTLPLYEEFKKFNII